MEYNFKQKIDTININIKIEEDLSIIHIKKNYEMIELYPKVQEIFKMLNIPEEKFKMRDKRVSSKVIINHNGIFIEFKTIPPRPGYTTDHTKKNLHIQMKGEYFLENDFNTFIEKMNEINPDSYSKIEVAFDFIESKDFLKNSMDIFLNHREKITKFEGKNKIFFNFNYETEESLNYSSASKQIKIYNKTLELKENKKKDLFYQKNPEFLGKTHYRIEISIMKSSIIDKNINLKEMIFKKNREEEVIKKIKDYFFKDFKIHKKSELKSILKQIFEVL